MTSYFSFISLLLIAACGFFQKNKPAPIEPPPEKTDTLKEEEPKSSNSTENSSNFKVQLLHDEAPNTYYTRLDWDLPHSTSGLVLKRIKLTEKPEKHVEFLPSSDRSYEDLTLEPNTLYSYEVTAMDSNTTFVVGAQKVFVPLDLKIEREMNLPRSDKALEFGRLIMKKSSVLRTLGANLVLNVNELESTEGVIDTLPGSGTAPQGGNAASGGKLTIHIKEAHGRLHVLARGQNGGGGGGRNGGGSIEIEARCESAPGRGGPGGQGGNGTDGTRGGDGGDSATVLVTTQNSKDFQIQHEISPGAAGGGGSGGPGGQGGDGGDGGDRDRYRVCPEGETGERCPNGNRGGDGSSGIPGNKQPVCFVLENAEFGDCIGFQSEIQSIK